MEESVYIGRQPILEREGGTFAFELLYCNNEEGNASSGDCSKATSAALNLLTQFGMMQIVGQHPLFLKVDSSFLLQEMVFSIPKEHFILALLEEIKLNKATIERIRYLKKEGYIFAIDDTSFSAETLAHLKPILPMMTYCKIDTNHADLQQIEPLINEFDMHAIKLIATKIETRNSYQSWSILPVEYFQGFYFARPNTLSAKAFSAEQHGVIHIWKLILDDVPLKTLTEAFEENPTLSLKLLQYMNSALFHFRDPITSITQVLTLIGRTPLLQWLLLLVHAKEMATPKQSEPLQTLLINRVEIMTGLHKLLKSKITTESEVYLVGLLSLIDILLNVNMRTVLHELNIDPIISSAIIFEEGELGRLLEVAHAIEQFDTDVIEAFLRKNKITMDEIAALTLKSIEHTNTLESSILS